MSLIIAALLLVAPTAVLCFQADEGSSAARRLAAGSYLYNRMADLVTPYGYPLEEHFVTTDDGHILRMYRIPHGKVNKTLAPMQRPPVLLAHGVQDSSAEYVLLGPGKALAFQLADAGYDVWMNNARGNVFSRSHKWLSTASPAFWAWSFDQMAQYDLPAELNYMLKATKYTQLSYVGYSQGTTTAFAALSAQPYLASQIKVAVMLAPIAFIRHTTSTGLRLISQTAVDLALQAIGPATFPVPDQLLPPLTSALCQPVPQLCLSTARPLAPWEPKNIDQSKLSFFLKFALEGSSTQTVRHWGQLVRETSDKVFTRFDYGPICNPLTVFVGLEGQCNRAKYGADKPPLYNLQNINKTPLYFISGGADSLADPTDVRDLVDALPKGAVREHVHVGHYEHVDFVWGKDAGDLVNSHVLGFLAAH